MPGCASSPTCVSDCADPNAVPCGVGTVCRASLCQAIRCDDPEYTGCPTGMTCDATGDPPAIRGGYSLFGTDQYPNNDVDYGPMLTESQSAAVAARCVFLRCNEAGAFNCLEGFRCDIASAPPTSTGCVGIPCGELGRCSSDAYICEPTSSKPRITRVDAHGCVTKNCEEGAPCPVSTECDFSRPGIGTGCAFIRCDQPGGSCVRVTDKCDPEPAALPSGRALTPDSYGCVPKHCAIDGIQCPEGMVCDPTNRSGLTTGCAPRSTGGTGATGGTAGSSGSGGEGGTVTDPNGPGVCR
jgi:hypothetical protein